MSSLLCPVCGKKSSGVCIDCVLEQKPVSIDKIGLCFCGCGRVRCRGRWGEYSEKVLEALVKRVVKIPKDIRLEKLKVAVSGEEAKAILDLIYEGHKFQREFDVALDKSSSTCEICSRKRSSYYEAVVQVRGKEFFFEMDLDYVMKAEKVKGGADYYMTSTNYAKQIAHGLGEKGYFVKESSKIYGQKDGIEIYRVYILVKHPDFNVGDVVEHKGKLLQVRGLGRWVKFTELDAGKHTTYPLNTLKKTKVLVPKDELRKAVVTEVRPDGIQLMDMASYKNYELKKHVKLKQGDEVGIALISGEAHLL